MASAPPLPHWTVLVVNAASSSRFPSFAPRCEYPSFSGQFVSLNGAVAASAAWKDIDFFAAAAALCTFLADLAEVIVGLGPLPSGASHELDGILTVYRRQSTSYPLLGALREPAKTLLYKVHDRLVRTYVPGEVGIKNL